LQLISFPTYINPSPSTHPSSVEAIQVWDAQKGAESGKVELLESVIPHERKELALALFHENNYKLNGTRDTFEALDIRYHQ
jgi:hypothetical protein